jgi:hypothetical protein
MAFIFSVVVVVVPHIMVAQELLELAVMVEVEQEVAQLLMAHLELRILAEAEAAEMPKVLFMAELVALVLSLSDISQVR